MNLESKSSPALALLAAGEAAPSVAWIIYFLCTVSVIGFISLYVLAAPFFLLGYFYRPAVRLADRILGAGTRLLMEVQPWLRPQVALDSALLRPGRGCLLVSNHRSHLDAFLLLSRIPGVRIFAKRSLFRVPFLGLGMHMAGHIPCTRGDPGAFQTALDQVEKGLRRGDRIHIFPEMSRCVPGFRGTRAFALGPFHAAMRTGVPIVPIAIRGTDLAWGKGAMRVQAGQDVRVEMLEPLYPRDFTSARELCNEARARIERAIL
jgi:1-acyl-sn-glycerol-3-phosphate acyltransferase